MDIDIRLAVPSDVPDMVEVLSRSWETAYKDIIPPEAIRERLETRPAVLRKVINEGNTDNFVVLDGGRIIGAMTLSIPSPHDGDAAENSCELQGVFIHPDYCFQDIGARTVEFAFDRALELGKTAVTAWIFAEDAPTMQLYEKCGFAGDGKTKYYDYGRLLKCVSMIKFL